MRALVLALVVALAAAGGADARTQRPRHRHTVVHHRRKRAKPKPKAKPAAKPKAAPKPVAAAAAPAAAPAPAVAPAPVLPTLESVVAAPAPAPAATGQTVAVAAPAAPLNAPHATTVTALDRFDGSFAFTLSSGTVAAGPLHFSFVNRDASEHDLSVRRPDGSVLHIASVDGGPGTSSDGDAELPAGTYTLFCAIQGHEAAGMRATLRVV